MDGHGSVHLGIFQQTVVDHGLGAVSHLLAGLEHELDGAFQLALMVLKKLGRTQQHGRVSVVAAHVAGIALGTEGQVVDLLHGQGVKVSPQQDAGTAAADGGYHAGGCLHIRETHLDILLPYALLHYAAALGLDPHLGQPLLNVSCRFGQVHAHLRNLVKIATVSHDLLLKQFGFFQ